MLVLIYRAAVPDLDATERVLNPCSMNYDRSHADNRMQVRPRRATGLTLRRARKAFCWCKF